MKKKFCGDININLLNEDSEVVTEYTNVISINDYGTSNKVSKLEATSISKNTLIIINQVLVNNIKLLVNIEDTALSDHRLESNN